MWADVLYSVDMSFTIGELSAEFPIVGEVSVPGLPRQFDRSLVSPTAITGGCLPIPTSGRLLQDGATASCASDGCYYTVGNWSVCPVSCGVGRQVRATGCRTAAGVEVGVERCVATPGLVMPTASRDCEVTCPSAMGYALDSSGSSFRVSGIVPLTLAGLVVGQRFPYGTSFEGAFTAPTFYQGASPGVFIGVVSVAPSDGDVDLAVAVGNADSSSSSSSSDGASSLSWTRSSAYGPVPDSLLITPGSWGLESGVNLRVYVSTYDPRVTLSQLNYSPLAAAATDHLLKLIPVSSQSDTSLPSLEHK